MKKVWILEQFVSPETMQKNLDEHIQNLAYETKQEYPNTEYVKILNDMIKFYTSKLAENPEGYWLGFEGKTMYKQFCSVAIDAMRRCPNDIFRVVEGEIEDGANYWIGYTNVKVNDKVLKYLKTQI